MCTVTFVPVKDKYFITSNRDEKCGRKTAIPPASYKFDNGQVIFPKDADAGGSWIAINENGNAAVLLNGAFQKHNTKASYRSSRGIIFLEIIKASLPVRYFTQLDLPGIEPFTLIILDNNSLYECRWDGDRKHCRQLRKNHHYIWSSSTLYDDEVAKKREQWFAAFLNKHPKPTQEDILNFHQHAGHNDKQNALKMDRNGIISTVSLTTVALDNESGTMKYIDLKENKIYEKEIMFPYALQDEIIF
ncbi:MAG: NRDE family protein [Ginsengibacter sp.]